VAPVGAAEGTGRLVGRRLAGGAAVRSRTRRTWPVCGSTITMGLSYVVGEDELRGTTGAARRLPRIGAAHPFTRRRSMRRTTAARTSWTTISRPCRSTNAQRSPLTGELRAAPATAAMRLPVRGRRAMRCVIPAEVRRAHEQGRPRKRASWQSGMRRALARRHVEHVNGRLGPPPIRSGRAGSGFVENARATYPENGSGAQLDPSGRHRCARSSSASTPGGSCEGSAFPLAASDSDDRVWLRAPVSRSSTAHTRSPCDGSSRQSTRVRVPLGIAPASRSTQIGSGRAGGGGGAGLEPRTQPRTGAAGSRGVIVAAMLAPKTWSASSCRQVDHARRPRR
jgi:hypothetical protein